MVVPWASAISLRASGASPLLATSAGSTAVQPSGTSKLTPDFLAVAVPSSLPSASSSADSVSEASADSEDAESSGEVDSLEDSLEAELLEVPVCSESPPQAERARTAAVARAARARGPWSGLMPRSYGPRRLAGWPEREPRERS